MSTSPNTYADPNWDLPTQEAAVRFLSETRFEGTGVPTRPLGRTGENVSILALGGWHVAATPDDKEAIAVMHAAIDEGLTFFDNAWDYHDGHAEEVMGKALAIDGKRAKVFLMTKNCNRDYKGSMQCLEDSLRRLQTDYLDLWQFHEVNYDNDPDWIFEEGGLQAALEAKQAGKVRHIGFTGHKDPSIHLNMLSKPFEWATSQMPINILDLHYRSFLQQVVPRCLQNGIGVIGMKGLGGGYPQGEFVEALGLRADECYRFALSQPIATQVVGITNMEQLQANVRVARELQPMTAKERQEFADKYRKVAGDGRHERFKSAKDHDGPHHRKQHGFALAGAAHE